MPSHQRASNWKAELSHAPLGSFIDFAGKRRTDAQGLKPALIAGKLQRA
jgi:hypothetical protein